MKLHQTRFSLIPILLLAGCSSIMTYRSYPRRTCGLRAIEKMVAAG